MRAHIVDTATGLIVNTIVVDDMSFEVGAGLILMPGDVGGPGWHVVEGVPIDPDIEAHDGSSE